MGFIGILKKYLHFHISYSIILNCQEHGGIPEWPKGADCKSVGNAFEGSNPSPTISRCGGTGRRTGLKILRDLYSRTGSIPVNGIFQDKTYIQSGAKLQTGIHTFYSAYTRSFCE